VRVSPVGAVLVRVVVVVVFHAVSRVVTSCPQGVIPTEGGVGRLLGKIFFLKKKTPHEAGQSHGVQVKPGHSFQPSSWGTMSPLRKSRATGNEGA
jgi:hypothetical protein